MTSVSQFSQYLLKQDPQRNPARATLYNFAKLILEPQDPFTPAVIQSFYARVLQYDHWQNNAQELSETVRGDLVGFLKQFALGGEPEEWLALRHPDTLQIVPIKLFQDLQALAEADHEPRRKSGDQIQCIRMSDTQILVLVLSPAGSLEVKVYPNLAMVWGSELRMVAPVTRLHYTSQLELTPHARQILEGNLLTTHSFHVDGDGAHGLVTRGYTLQKFETFIRARLPDTQDLFHSLKKVERHFINPQSDPYYQEMVGRLERANRMLNHPTLEHLAEAERALNRGRICLKNIFPNDRLLTLLITHLDYGISQRRSEGPTPQQIPR